MVTSRRFSILLLATTCLLTAPVALAQDIDDATVLGESVEVRIHVQFLALQRQAPHALFDALG